jgi:uncharacterized protein (TIGR03435 family)
MIVGASIFFALIHSAPCRAQSQAQDGSANIPPLEYDVVSIKRNSFPPGTNLAGRIGTSDTPDGLTARFVPIKQIIQRAFGAESYQISGGPDWLNSERYDVDAKFDSSTADELQKLSPADRILTRQLMLQKILAERFNLTVHKESKELQTYSLIVAKNGPKLHEVKLDDAEASKPKPGPAPGSSQMTAGAAGGQIRGFASPLSNLAVMLTNFLHRPVIDRTGLTGIYDFTLRWTPDENQAQVSSNASGLPSSDPTGGPSIFTAIQEQLGLKLESAKGPVEIIMIDKIERPSGN